MLGKISGLIAVVALLTACGVERKLSPDEVRKKEVREEVEATMGLISAEEIFARTSEEKKLAVSDYSEHLGKRLNQGALRQAIFPAREIEKLLNSLWGEKVNLPGSLEQRALLHVANVIKACEHAEFQLARKEFREFEIVYDLAKNEPDVQEASPRQ